MSNYKVKLIYFRFSGKYYSDATYQTTKENLWEILEEVRLMALAGNLPGLVHGANEFHISVDVPEHPYNHPHLVMCERCPHLHIELHRRLYAAETRYQPAEYEEKAYCKDCEEWLDVEDIPNNDKVEIKEMW